MEQISPLLLTFLLNALWQIPVVAGIAAIACKLMPNGPARHRHGVWVAALSIALLLPLTSLRIRTAFPSQAAAPPVAESPSTLPAIPSIALPNLSQTRPAPAPARTVTLSRAMAQLLVAAYLLFLLYQVVSFILALYRTWTIHRDASSVSPSPVLDAVIARCRNAFWLHRVRVLSSRRIAGPVAAGAVILPERMLAETSPDVLTTAIGHEMAHIARHDFTLKLFYEILSLPVAFHPATAWIRREIERTREMACDELVATRLLDAGVYAGSIAVIAGAIGPLRAGIMPGVFDGDILEERIRRLIERRGSDLGRARAALAGGLAAFAVCLALASGLAVSALAQSAARPEMLLGVDAYNRGDFAGAARHFENGVAADPANARARLFLANSYWRQFLSEGKFSADEKTSSPLLVRAKEQYQEILARDPKNITATFGLVAMSGPERLSESREMVLKAIDSDPNRADTYYTLGTIDWQMAYRLIREAASYKGSGGLRVEDAAVRSRVRQEATPYLEEGLRSLQIAMEKEPDSADSMAFMNLLVRAQSAVVESEAESQMLVRRADEWVQKALAAKKKGRYARTKEIGLDIDSDPELVTKLPPPPPPPPPPPTPGQ